MEKVIKVNKEFSLKSFSMASTVTEYSQAVDSVGLWESEKEIFKEYIDLENSILDIGCGAGRTTIGLYELGYKNIIGIDFSEEMIKAAVEISNQKSIAINFDVQDACALPYPQDYFDTIIFSFTGLTQIPFKKNRSKAIKEIYRSLKKGGVFIFTTHDRDDENFQEFWIEEEKKWSENNQDKSLEIYGDRIIRRGEREIYIHFPIRKEVIDELESVGFNLVKDVLRSEYIEEPQVVLDFSTDSRFWIFRK